MTRRRTIAIAGMVAALPLIGIIAFWCVTRNLYPLIQQFSEEFQTPVNIGFSKSLEKGGGTSLTIEVPSKAMEWVDESRDQLACHMAAFARVHYQQPETLKYIEVLFSTVQLTAAGVTISTHEAAYRWQVTDPDFLACKPGLGDAERHFKAGAILDGQGRSQEALTEYNEAIRLSPRYVMAHSNRGTVYNDSRQYLLAIEDFNEAIRLNSTFVPGYVNRAFSYDSLGQYERAIQDYDEAIRLDPKQPLAYGNRCASYNSLGQYQQAIKDCNEAIRLEPGLAQAYAVRALAYTRLGMDTEAQQNIDMAVKRGFDAIGLKGKVEELRKGR